MQTATAAAVVFSQQENKGHFVPETSVEKKKVVVSLCYAKTVLHKNIEVFLFTLFLEPFHALYSQSLFICRL